MNDVVKLKADRWRSLLNEALDYYAQTSQAFQAQNGQVNMLSPTEHQWSAQYLGVLCKMMATDMAKTSEGIAFLEQEMGVHKDTIDATSYRASMQAMQNMKAIANELVRKSHEIEQQPSLPRVVQYGPPGNAKIEHEDSDPDSWDEPTSPGRPSPAVGTPVQFFE